MEAAMAFAIFVWLLKLILVVVILVTAVNACMYIAMAYIAMTKYFNVKIKNWDIAKVCMAIVNLTVCISVSMMLERLCYYF